MSQNKTRRKGSYRSQCRVCHTCRQPVTGAPYMSARSYVNYPHFWVCFGCRLDEIEAARGRDVARLWAARQEGGQVR